jgi:5-methyltetrahydrofolate--homocysteine methyltransferase
MEPIIERIHSQIVNGRLKDTIENIQQAIEADVPIEKIVNEGMIDAMREVGNLFEKGEYYVPEMLVSARAMQHGMNYLKPYLATSDIKSLGKVVIGTVKGDLHDIGKNLVSVMLEGAGFTIINLGTDVPPERFVEAVSSEQPDILALSGLLTTTIPGFPVVIQTLVDAGIRDKVKVMVGGAPVTEMYAQQIGADGFAPDASRAVRIAKLLIQNDGAQND